MACYDLVPWAFDVHQNVVVAVTHFSETHVGGAEGGTQQAFQCVEVVVEHAVLGGWRQLVGDQLADMTLLQAQVLQAGEGEKTGQQQGQQETLHLPHSAGTAFARRVAPAAMR